MPLAIDFGTRAIHLVRGQVSRAAVTVKEAYIEHIPSGVLQDGVIREFGSMEIALKTMLAKNRIRDHACNITINGSHIYTRELDVPNAKAKVLNDVVAFEVQSTMSVPTGKDIAVEYTLSKQKAQDKPDVLRVRASAIQADYIYDYAKLMRNCGLTPVAMDIHPNALIKILANSDINDKPQRQGGSLMLIDMGAVTSTVYIISNGEIIYSRIIPAGGIDIERYVTSLNSDAGEGNQIDIAELDLSLNSLRSNEPLGNAVRPLVTTINDNIQRINQFLAGRLQNGKVDCVYLFGRTAVYNHFEKTLGEAFGLPTEVIRKVSKVTMPVNVSIAPFINAIGALIRLAN